MIQRINELIAEILAERGLDARRVYTNVTSAPPDGRVVTCESSDTALLDDLDRRLAEPMRGGLELRLAPLPDPRSDLPTGLIAASSVVDVRRSPAHTSELLTEIVYGDPVEPLKDGGEWVLARLDDGYVGWIRTWHVQPLAPADQTAYWREARHRVATNHAVVLEAPDRDALPVTDLVIGTRARVTPCGKRGWRAITLPDGKAGFIAGRSVEPLPRRRGVSRERLAATGLRFLGIAYTWGGTTPKGFDCSGLIQRVYRLNGLLLPRDADLQSEFGRLKTVKSPDDLATGDLLFFGKNRDSITHVGMALSDGLFLHAYGQVRVSSLDPRNPLYDGKLVSDWQLTRDPIAGASDSNQVSDS